MAAFLPRAARRLRNWREDVWNVRDRWLPRLPLPYVLEEGGVLLLPAGDQVGEALFKGRAYERAERRFMYGALAVGMIVFDVGANIGLYTVIAARRVGPAGRVHSFEPSPAEFACLTRNVRTNRLRNVVANEVAVGGSRSEVTLTVYGDGWGAYNTLAPSRALEVPSSAVIVSQVTLDAYVGDYQLDRVDIIKIDVEGAEQSVLHGGESVVWPRLRPVVMCEFSDRRTALLGYRAGTLWEYLARFDYRWFEVDPQSRLQPSPLKEEYVYDNLVGIPAERLAEFGC